MRTVHPTHVWNHSIGECFHCACSVQDDLALAPCMKAQPAPVRVQQPKAPDLLALSMDDESRKR